jgi:FlaA1/EpsC-like NDP-sugar epimerase
MCARQRSRLRFGPAVIVALDVAETALFEIGRQMQHLFPDVPFHPELGDIRNPVRLNEIFRFPQPAVVFHAAAYKHVPLRETHIFEAVENNVFGTQNVANAAIEAGVERFVLISSDKAVNPTSVTGATKRISELLLLGLNCDVK